MVICNSIFIGQIPEFSKAWEVTIMKTLITVVALAGTLISASPALAFQPRMASSAIDSEVKQRCVDGESFKSIVAGGLAAGVSPAVLTSSMILSCGNPAAVVTAMVEAGMPAKVVVEAAVASGADSKAMVAAAIAAGANPGSLTASIGGSRSGDEGGGTGFGASGFGESRASTLGGGGRSGASPS
jgi:hypothetical protein